MTIFQLLMFYKQLVHMLKVKSGLLSIEQTGPLIYHSFPREGEIKTLVQSQTRWERGVKRFNKATS